MQEYYKSLLKQIDKARKTGSCAITGLLVAKRLLEKQYPNIKEEKVEGFINIRELLRRNNC